jgi:hypothetical protein
LHIKNIIVVGDRLLVLTGESKVVISQLRLELFRKNAA